MELGGDKSYQNFLKVHICMFSRTRVTRKLLCGQRCPWRQGRSRNCPFSLTRRPLASPGLASYSVLTWALAEALGGAGSGSWTTLLPFSSPLLRQNLLVCASCPKACRVEAVD